MNKFKLIYADPFETHVCDNCAGELAIETNPNGVMHDEEAEKAVQES